MNIVRIEKGILEISMNNILTNFNILYTRKRHICMSNYLSIGNVIYGIY